MKKNVVIGKYTLESLTNGMYAMPLDLYREYIQNSVDSIDEALELIKDEDHLGIKIDIDTENKKIEIFDNGCGVKSENAIHQLVDIGNSKKDRNSRRGFRGIGRLAGLGYCDKLVFETSYYMEDVKTTVEFNASKLRELLLNKDPNIVSVEDVTSRIISTGQEQAPAGEHYFRVKLLGVNVDEKLLDTEIVEDYLIQHAPLRYSKSFGWNSLIIEKCKIIGYGIPSYEISINGRDLFKPYEDTCITDRIKKVNDSIHDVKIEPYYRNGKLAAIVWWGETNYYGTILDNSIKGIRLRQGNILIGNKTTCNSLFKEERFNGWLVGEVFALDPELIANARRDDFEKNEAYYDFIQWFTEWSYLRAKEIRRVSYERHLSDKKTEVMGQNEIENCNSLDIESDLNTSESELIDDDESDVVAKIDYIDKLSFLLNQKKNKTKYNAINMKENLTFEQRKMLEKVFDIVVREFKEDESNRFINTIATNL